jgi:hypothetical protein
MRLSSRRIGLGLSLLLASGCNGALDLNLVINDPCNQRVLSEPTLGLDHIELVLTSPALAQPEGTVWSKSDGQGEVADLSPVADATLAVTGRASTGGGEPGAVVAAISVGLLDLTRADGEDPVELSIVFGRLGTFFNTTDADAASNGNVQCTALGAERHGHTATLLPDGKVFIAGGTRQSATSTTYWESTEIFDPRTGLFEFGPNMKWVRQAHTATLLDDGRVLVAGGIGLIGENVDTLRAAVIFDPESGEFAGAPISMVEQRANHTATLLGDGRVLLAGGTVGARELQTTEIFDPATGTFCAGPSLSPQTRAFHSAVRVSANAVALIGGQGSGAPLGLVQFVEVAGCNQGTAKSGPTLGTPRSYPAAALAPAQDAIIVAGGFEAAVNNPESAEGSDAVEVVRLNPANLSQSTVACGTLGLMSPRGAAALAEIPGGVVIVGGIGAPGQALPTAETLLVNDAQSCDIAINWTNGDLSTARAGARATPLIGGDVLVTGGFAVSGGRVQSLGPGEIFVRPR